MQHEPHGGLDRPEHRDAIAETRRQRLELQATPKPRARRRGRLLRGGAQERVVDAGGLEREPIAAKRGAIGRGASRRRGPEEDEQQRQGAGRARARARAWESDRPHQNELLSSSRAL